MIQRQVRILIGDIGDATATICADHLRRLDRWVVTRTQNSAEMMDAFRTVRPDIIILNASVFTMDIVQYITRIKSFMEVRILVLFTAENPFLMNQIEAEGAVCILMPDTLEGLICILEDACGAAGRRSSESIMRLDLDVALTQILVATNIPPHLQGFHYLRSAVTMVYLSGNRMNVQIAHLYPAIAAQYNSTVQRVEHSIRHAIAQAWNSNQCLPSSSYFSLSVLIPSKPSNTEFIALLAEWLRLRFDVREEQIRSC